MKRIRIFLSLIFICYLSILPEIFAQDVQSNHAMVATAHPVASEVGVEILRQGGNAVDAAMAIAFALSIAEPNASGIGGGGFMLLKMADSNRAVMIDYREMAPMKATKKFYYENEKSFSDLARDGIYSIGVPGLVACAEKVLPKYGTMTLAQILQPAIRLCNSGIEVTEKLSGMIMDNLEKIAQFPATSKIYLKDMMPFEAGDTLRNPDLAKTFGKIAAGGGSVFYQGEIAKKICQTMQTYHGLMDSTDLKSYRAIERKPVTGTYRGYRIVSSAPPSGGGTFLIELLNIMEGYDVKKMGHNSAQYLHTLSEAMKLIFADKALNSADPDFYRIPVDTFVNKEYARRLRRRILPDKARFDYLPQQISVRESNSTSHFSVVDEQGNAVALTQSINHWFGSGIVVEGTGILLNDHLHDFSDDPDSPNAIEPHKRPTSSIAPTIVLKDGKPIMVLGTPGGTRIISALAQIIMNVIDFGMSMDDAIEAPRIHC
ncbi:gamma-glutamyltransferase, partial [candidate division KSB1 bacterium 4484_87]